MYEKICELVPDFEIFDFSEYCETMILIQSRVFTIPMAEDKVLNCLLPYADMINHSKESNVVYRYDY